MIYTFQFDIIPVFFAMNKNRIEAMMSKATIMMTSKGILKAILWNRESCLIALAIIIVSAKDMKPKPVVDTIFNK